MECTQFSKQAWLHTILHIQQVSRHHNNIILCITETWLHDSILNTEIFSHNYTIYWRDRGSRGGRIIIAISDNLISQISLCHRSLESIAVENDIQWSLRTRTTLGKWLLSLVERLVLSRRLPSFPLISPFYTYIATSNQEQSIINNYM